MVCISVSAGETEARMFTAVELKSGDKVTGTVLNNTYTVMTPYSNITLEKSR